MKVCKKCKKHVANKMRICKYCGADVSKAKIIKEVPKPTNKTPIIEKKEVIEQPKIEVIITEESKTKLKNKKTEKKDKKKDKIKQKTNKKNKKEKNLKIKTKKTKEKKNKNQKPKNKKNILSKVLIPFKLLKKLLNKIVGLIKKIIKKIKSICKRIKQKLKRKYLKRIIIIILVLTVLGVGSYYGIDIYKKHTTNKNTIEEGEKATNKKIFAIGDLITYKGVDYKVVKVETSEGNSYKQPKEGNQFLIVTVYIKNNTSDKIKYSYENWTMLNSKEENKKRIFTSINVDTALYSGDLVIGGIKTGSMVFEQPINDPKLILNFYELTKDKNGEDIINEDKKIFSVSIKVPKEKEPQIISKENK